MKLKLGKLPETQHIKLPILLSAEVKAKIDRYAELHSKAWGQEVSAAGLIPHILKQFLENDREFHRLERLRQTSAFDLKKPT